MSLWKHLRELQEDAARTIENRRMRTIDLLVERITQIANGGYNRAYISFEECEMHSDSIKGVREFFRGNGLVMRVNYRHREITLTIPEYDMVKHQESNLVLRSYLKEQEEA